MRLSRQLTIEQALRAIDEAGFNNRFRIIFGRKKWALILVHQIGDKRPRQGARIDGSTLLVADDGPTESDFSGESAGE
jgi:hypothetical protein